MSTNTGLLYQKFITNNLASTRESHKPHSRLTNAREGLTTSAAAADKNAEAAAGGATPPAYVTKEYLDNVRFRIFGTHIGNGLRSGRKVLRKNLIGDKVLAWYPQTEAYGKPHQGDKLWEDPDLFVAKDRLERYQRRGKGPPKKGAGKRASRKK